MAVKPLSRQARIEFGPFAVRPDPSTLPDWFIYVSDEGAIYRVRNGLWVTLGTLPAMEAVHIVGAGGEPAFQNSWSSVAGYGPVGFWKFGELIYTQGLCSCSADPVANSVMWNMPADYRPVNPRYVQASTNTPATTLVGFLANGDVIVTSNLAAGQVVYFDGLFYRI